MRIYTAGGDTHYWTVDGKAHEIQSENILTVSAEAAKELNDILASFLGIRNPQSTRELSESKLAALLKGVPMKDKMDALKKALKAVGQKLHKPPKKTENSAYVVSFDGPRKLSKVSINSGNQKTGPTLGTNSAQASCPDGKNNTDGFQCPLYGDGCYAEQGLQYLGITRFLNKEAGVDPSKGKRSSSVKPEDVAEDEMKALKAAHLTWQFIRLNTGVRAHVVGDCVNPESARMVSSGLELYVTDKLEGLGVVADRLTKNVWNYTHGWRTVNRSAWSPNISVLASCDTMEDLDKAHAKGYGCCIVVPEYYQNEFSKQEDLGKYSGKAFKAENGWLLIPCPHEVHDKNEKGKHVWCLECGLCMKDDFLRKNKAAIAFAAHTKKAKAVSSQLVNIKGLGE